MNTQISRRGFLCAAGIASASAVLTACGGSSSSTAASSTAGSAAASSTSGPQTITFYPRDANLASGLISGFKGDYFAEHGFNLEVWAYSDEKTNAILASGDLPDVMFIPEKSLDIMIQGGMLLNLDDYLDKMPHLKAYKEVEPALSYVREFKSAGTGSVYGIPTSIGESYVKYKWLDSTERNAVRLHWDTYEKIGAPAINSFEDLIDVMEQMQKVIISQSESMSETQKVVEEVISQISNSMQSIRQIKDSTENLASTRNEVLQAVEDLSAIAQDNVSGTKESYDETERVVDTFQEG